VVTFSSRSFRLVGVEGDACAGEVRTTSERAPASVRGLIHNVEELPMSHLKDSASQAVAKATNGIVKTANELGQAARKAAHEGEEAISDAARKARDAIKASAKKLGDVAEAVTEEKTTADKAGSK
jgi:hypothetical protein